MPVTNPNGPPMYTNMPVTMPVTGSGGPPPAGGIPNPISPIISTPAIPGVPSAPTAPITSTYDAATWKVDPKQTVQGQMTSMIDPNNPYYQAWSTAGKQDAAAGGFTNGSMQQTGILNSVMRNGIPIATADATTNANAAATNTNAINQASAAGALAKNSLASTVYNGDVSLANTTSNNATSASNTNANNSSQQLISQTHDANSILLQNSGAAMTAFNQFQAAVANIDASTTMDATAKKNAIANQQDIFNTAVAGLTAKTPGVPDVSSLLKVGTNDPANSPDLKVRQANWDVQNADLAAQAAAAPHGNRAGISPEFIAIQKQIDALGPRPTA